MKRPNILLAAILVWGAVGVASADVLTLKSGEAVTGKYEGGDQAAIQFSVNGVLHRYAVADVSSITFTPVPLARTAPASPPTYSSGRTGTGPQPPATDQPPVLRRTTPPATASGSATTTITAPPAPRPANITIPGGTEITVRMIDPVDSEVNLIGDTFRASLDEPIVVNGQTVAARGADVTAKLTEVAQAGRIAGRSELSLVLLDITLNGRKHEVTTSEVYEAGSSRGRQTATRVGVGAAIGATIGAIAGGGGGAARGAAAGAGAGTAIQVLTKGEKVQIPSEARLVFTLQNALTI
jgi:hypothetical protein